MLGPQSRVSSKRCTIGVWSFALVGKKLNHAEVRSAIKELAETGTDLISLQVYEAYLGKLCYRSRRYPDFVLVEQADTTRAMYEACVENGIRIWLHCDERAAPYGSALQKHFADCSERNAQGELCPMWDGVLFCLHSRYRNFLKDVYQEALELFPEVEGVVVVDEGGFVVGNEGYCTRCLTKFRQKYGLDPPLDPDWLDLEGRWWQFIRERLAWWTEYVDFLAKACKEVRPDVHTAVMLNPHGLEQPSLAGVDWWEIARLNSVDSIGTAFHFRHEHHPVAVARAAAFVTQIARRAGKSAFLKLAAHREISHKDLLFSAYHSAAGGVDTILFVNLETLVSAPGTQIALGTICTRIRDVRLHSCEQSPASYAGLWFSQSEFYTYWGDLATGYNAEHMGLFQAAALNSLPVQFVFDEDLERSLSQDLRVLVFVVPTEITSTQVQMLQRFVSAGHGIVGVAVNMNSPSASVRRLLTDLFRCRYQGLTGPITCIRYPDHSKMFTTELPTDDLPVYQSPTKGGAFNYFSGRGTLRQGYKRPALVLLPGSRPVASLVDDDGVTWPGVVVAHHGKGRVVLLAEPLGTMVSNLAEHATGLDSHWLRWGKEAGRVLADCFSWAAATPPPITVSSLRGNISSHMSRQDGAIRVRMVNNDYFQADRVTVKASLQYYSDKKPTALGFDSVNVTKDNGHITLEGWISPADAVTVEFSEPL